MSQRNIKLTIEYDGTNYHGWQVQDGIVTVQGTIEEILSGVVKHSVTLIGSSRTDAGVHALGQVASFRTTCGIPAEKIPFALNALLPEDIAIKSAVEVDESFHARFSTVGKKYRYIINNSRIPSAINAKREYFCCFKLNFDSMIEAAKKIQGTHDFKGFAAAGCTVEDTVRTINSIELMKQENRIVVEVSGTGFLYNMVRIIVGTLVDVGRGKLTVDEIERILIEGDRKMAGQTAPPQGLYLVEVYY